MTLLLLGHRTGNPGLVAQLGDWIDELRAVLDRPDGARMFRALVTYIQLVGEIPHEDLHRFMEQVGPDAEEAYVTTADMLRAEGEARGEARGEAKGQAKALLQLLTLRFGDLAETRAATVRAASVEQVETWTARVLTASTIDDVLR